MTAACRYFLFLFVSATMASHMTLAQRIGAEAPALHVTKLLQAPAETKLSWASLRGKVVVIEFSATWCLPCMEAIPHINKLVASQDSSKVVFITVDPEAPSTVETFIQRRKLATWVVEDPDNLTAKAYHVDSFPKTIILNANGHIAAVTTPDKLTEEVLSAMVKRSSRSLLTTQSANAGARDNTQGSLPNKPIEDTSQSLSDKLIWRDAWKRDGVEILIRAAATQEKTSDWVHDDATGSVGFTNVPARVILSLAYPSIPTRRFLNPEALPQSHYMVIIKRGPMPELVIQPFLRAAAMGALDCSVSQNDEKESALVVMGADIQSSVLRPPASMSTPHHVTIEDGKLMAMNATIAEIGGAMEGYYGVPFVDETGTTGSFDAEFDLPAKGSPDLPTALSAALRMQVALETRSIPYYEVVSTRP
jgi:thiol-disulfide isomerase/thioredoxin